MAFNSANGQNLPERPRSRPDPNVLRESVRIIPLLPPKQAVEYRVITSSERITSRLGIPSARLVEIPLELNEVAVWVPPRNTPALKPDDIAYELNSCVRYRGGEKELVVATYRLSPAAAQKPRILPNSENLPDGTPAGVEAAEGGNYPNRIVFEKNNLMIVLGGNLPMQEIKRLATTVQLR